MIIPSKFDGYGEGGRLTSTRRVYDSGGASAVPTSQTVTQTTIPEYAKPYVETMLGQASALTDVNANPYMQYQGARAAQFSPLQQQAFENAGMMATAPQLEQGTALAGTAGLMGLGMAGYRPESFIQPGTAQSYMSPYIQNVVDVQQREAKRQADIAAQSQQAQAARAGAFGGARDLINRNEANRALQTQLAGIQAMGQQNAFQQAQQQFNTEQQQQQQARQLGLQGLQTAIQGAGQIGGLGQQQFGQAMDINKLQAAYGGQQQQQAQNILNQQYQDFLNFQNYPYKQLGFMSDILRGVPLTQQTQSIYAPPPNMLGQIAGLGAGLYGSLGKAGGGMVDAYAEGGSVTSNANVESILDKLSDQQLQQAKQIALAQRDMGRVQMIDEELAERASMKSGLGSAFNMLPQDRQEAVTQMAGGGIVAFADGGVSPEFDVGDTGAASSDPFANLRRVGLSSAFSDLGRLGREGKSIEEYYGEGRNRPYLSGSTAMTAAQPETQTYTRTGGAPAPSERERAAAPSVAKGKNKAPGKGVAAAAEAVANAAAQTTGTARTPMKTAFTEGLAMLKDEQGEADSKRMVELINRISKSEAPDKMDMLANFGFRMAAAASKPGARLLSAAAEGAQVVPEMRAQAKKEAREAQRLGATLEMEKLKLDAATRKGDRAAALQHAQNIRIMEGQEAQLNLTGQQLAETKRSNIAREGLQAQQIAASKERYAAQDKRLEAQMLVTRRLNAQKAQEQASKDWNADIAKRGVRSQYPSLQAYQKALFDNLQLQSLPQLRLLPDED